MKSFDAAAVLSWKLLVLTLLQATVALVFLKGFLLTRVELPDVAAAHGPSSSQPPPAYQKAVVLIVDAVRYDFLCGKPPTAGQPTAGSLMPRTLQWVQAQAGAAIASKFIADTPTITMSRLKALLTGGLPTFLDVGQSFSASAISEDNLLQQLLAKGKRLVMMGDDTWMQLAQDAFTEAYPYPSFNVHDLHTVDDGVWEHLLPLLDRPDSWDVLIAHYLGVDHAGHTHGVNSRQMQDKLAQMDQQISTVIASLVAQAGPRGAYEDTLLLVISDHGQTLGGDHGGGTPDETDSILVAMSLRSINSTLQQQQEQEQEKEEQKDGDAGHSINSSAINGDSLLLRRLMTSAGYADALPPAAQQAAPGSPAAVPAAAAWSDLLVCGNTVPQIDLTPLLAQLLGVAIPFGNLGKVPPHLFVSLAAGKSSRVACAVQPAQWLPQYAGALAANAAQVNAYLNRYAAVGGLPAAQLATVNALYAAVQRQHNDLQREQQQQQGEAWDVDTAQLEQLVSAQLSYLGAAADLARRRFTLFQQGPIWAGCALGVLLLVAQLAYLRQVLRRRRDSTTQRSAPPWDSFSTTTFAGLAAFHALSLFSVGLLMGEGRLTCGLLAAATLLLLRAALLAVLQARKVALCASKHHQQHQQKQQQQASNRPANTCSEAYAVGTEQQKQQLQQQVRLVLMRSTAPQASWSSWQPTSQAVRAAVSMLVCNVSLQLLGLIDRAGQDPHDKTQPTSELLVGPDAAWQRAAFTAFTVGPLLAVWGIYTAASRTLAASSRVGAAAGEAAASGASAEQAAAGAVAGKGSRGDAAIKRSSSSSSVVVVECLRILSAAQLVCLALFWVAQLYGHSGDTICGAAAACWVAWQQSPVLGPAAAAVESLLGRRVILQGSRALASSGLCSLPLRLLLPRLVYLPALVVLAFVVLLAALPLGCGWLWPWSAAQRPPIGRHKSCNTGGRTPAAAAAALLPGSSRVSESLLWVCAVLAAPVVMVLGFKGPATMLLAQLQAVGLCRLLRLQGAAKTFAVVSSTDSRRAAQTPGPNNSSSSGQADRSATGADKAALAEQQAMSVPSAAAAADYSNDDGSRSVLGAGMWGLMALQLFFCSGHFCEFSGLQYASAFIGFDDMVWYSSGGLLLLNTSGFFLLGCLGLPVLLACCTATAATTTTTCESTPVLAAAKPADVSEISDVPPLDGSSTVSLCSGSELHTSVAGGLGGVCVQEVECGLWVINSMRFAALVVSLVSAAVQQQHILLWAIFAPKLVFELWFMAVTAVGQLLVARLLSITAVLREICFIRA